MRKRTLILPLALSLAVVSAADVASAFCGFYVAPNDAPLYNDATMVALMREGTRTYFVMAPFTP